VGIQNLAVRRYANPPQTGAIQASDGVGWTIRSVDASYNHGAGIRAGAGSRVLLSTMTYNGQAGLLGNTRYGAPMRIERSEIAYNRQLGYNWLWEGGGLKIANSSGTIFVRNWVHHNAGPGIWFDVYNLGAKITSNVVEHNANMGIFYEISYGPAEISSNIVRNNGTGQPGQLGAGIAIANSRDVQVVGNTLTANARGILLTMTNRGSGPYGPLEIANVAVRDNDISMTTGTTGIVDETGNDAYYTDKGNVFEGNVYRLDNPAALRFSWTGRWSSPVTWQQWQGLGNDEDGHSLRPHQRPRSYGRVEP
jgi:nitrous oxidase accessory protein NosD